MARGVPVIYRYTRFEKRLGILATCSELVHTEELNGEDTIEFRCRVEPTKGDRLLWMDDVSTWHEHVVVRIDTDERGVCTVYAENSACELIGDYIEETVIDKGAVSDWMRASMAPTRWRRRCNIADGKKRSGVLYRTNALAALHRTAETFGGELTFQVSVDSYGVVRRTVVLDTARGTWRGARFTYGRNMVGCTKTVLDDDVITALYGYGAGLPRVDEDGNYTGGYTRHITFGDINNGKNYVADEDARKRWGRWNADKTAKVHFYGEVSFSKCEVPKTLLALTKAELKRVCEPQVSYDIDAACVEGVSRVELGDTIAIVDTEVEPEWRVMKRVLKRQATYGDEMWVRLVAGAMERRLFNALTESAQGDIEAAAVDEGLEPRCLLVDGNRLVFTYLPNSLDPYGGEVQEVYSILDGCAALSDVPWYKGGSTPYNYNVVTQVVFHKSFAAVGVRDLSYWFYGFLVLESVVGMRYLPGVTSLRYFLNGARSLPTLDLRGFSPAKLTNLYYAFGGCSALTTIYADADWALPADMESTYGTFWSCNSLVGGNGTHCDGTTLSMKGTYMVVDTENTPGYLTAL